MTASKGSSEGATQYDRAKVEALVLLVKGDEEFRRSFEQDPQRFLNMLQLSQEADSDLLREVGLGVGMTVPEATCRNTCWFTNIL